MTDNSPKKHIVVVGGSYGGVACVNKLLRYLSKDTNVQITLIEKCDARYHCVASYRALVQKDFAKNLWIPYSNLFPKGSPHRIYRGLVKSIYNDHVLVTPIHDGAESSTSSSEPQRVSFDYLVIATGSMIPSPAKWTVNSSKEGLRKMDQIREDIVQSERIVIIGGGACGVELSGEIKYAFPDKTVTLIHDMPHLVDYPRFPESFKEEARRYLTNQGVEVILNERANIEGLSRENPVQKAERAVKLQGSDRVIHSDLQFFSIGIKVDTTFISTLEPPPDKVTSDKKSKTPSFDPQTLLDPKSHVIKVRSTLQLDHDAFPNIFAIGDVSNADPVPTCMAAVAAGETAARNLMKLIRKDEKEAAGHQRHHLHLHQHQPSEIMAEARGHSDDETNGYSCHSWNKLENYLPTQTMMVLAMNPSGGVSHLPVLGTWFGNIAARVAKSSDLFSGRFWREMNMPRP
ncbi:FAD/NAD(P)-binding domain-containing protein [Linnemannia elongata AG-77]|uniref:FAD/NAD(P)-binding domain-containing protein n=1 Tax=Linnemannia elongata AG-77 TaxID=1314771 RepID=A0A197JDN0_9FUNG|nr:FAD/NAD(P)-binding domain-containing protein [Linnemannia elongata AG-77]